jgi:hypothetical protein
MRSFCILKTELRNPRIAAMLKLKPAGIIDKALLFVCHVLEISNAAISCNFKAHQMGTRQRFHAGSAMIRLQSYVQGRKVAVSV